MHKSSVIIFSKMIPSVIINYFVHVYVKIMKKIHIMHGNIILIIIFIFVKALLSLSWPYSIALLLKLKMPLSLARTLVLLAHTLSCINLGTCMDLTCIRKIFIHI